MNTSINGENVNQSELVLKLCNHLARNDQRISENLSKLAFHYLSTSQSVDINEDYIVGQIKEILSMKSKESVEQFQLLYSNICKLNVLQNRSSILAFMLNLIKWNMVNELDKFPTYLNKKKSYAMVKSNNSQESIRQIYHLPENKAYLMQNSNINVHSSHTTITSSTTNWTKSGSELISPRLSSTTLITENDLIQETIYSFLGIEGRYFRKEPGGLGLILDTKIEKSLTPSQRGLLERLTGISYLHNQLKQYCDNNDKQSGIICQSLIAILRDELSVYYKTVAILQTAVNKQTSMDYPNMTLKKILIHIQEHQIYFEWLAYIAEQCMDKKGGALITAIHGFLQHGSNCVQKISGKVLTAVCKPLYIMLSRWLFDGEINDPYNEFFIKSKNINTIERLWYDKYTVRNSMIPSFITMEQAKKILATGKSINFLRQICKDNSQLPGRDSLEKLFKTTSVDALFAPEQSIEFHSILEKVYQKTSFRLLNLLKEEHKLFQHLQSLRRYLLLGQGDFIRHLLELLAPELHKPSQDIYGHTLSAILESAIGVTNAQYEDQDTLQRLNISCLGHSHGDTGWDVFSLIYVVDGPVGIIFQPTMSIYQCLFGALWKAKRMEFVLTNMRKQQITISKLFKQIKELKPIMHIFHILSSEMIHFLHQTQYYFLFEVLECSWAEMLRQVNQAECLDDIIIAHTVFLNSVQCGVLLDESSGILFSQLRSIYNCVLTLEKHQESLYLAAYDEYKAYNEFKRKSESPTSFGLTIEDELKAKERILNFQQFLNQIKTKAKHLSQTYKQFVNNYLKLLSNLFESTNTSVSNKKNIQKDVTCNKLLLASYLDNMTTHYTSTDNNSRYGSINSLLYSNKKKQKQT